MSPINALDQEKHQLNGFMHKIGGRLIKWEPDHAVIELEVAELHRNGIGVVHGGVMASLIDTPARAPVYSVRSQAISARR